MSLTSVVVSCCREMSLDTLPYEILHQIAHHLDSKSASHFAVTARTFQLPAESSVWRKISLTHGDLSGAVWRRQLEEDTATSTNWLSDSRRALDVLLEIVSTSHRRASYIRRLELYLPPAQITADLIELLTRIAKSLEEILVQLPPTADTPQPRFGFISTSRLFESLETPLRALRRCHLDVHNGWQRIGLSLFRNAPNLQDVHVRNHSREPLPASDLSQTRHAVPDLDHLVSLTFEESHEEYVPLMAAIIERAPALRTVALLDHSSRSRRACDDPLVTAMSKLQHIVRLDISPVFLDAINGSIGFDSVEELGVLWTVAMMEERQPQVRSVSLNM